jgi:hypothetical protein
MRRAQLAIAGELNWLLQPARLNAGQFMIMTFVAAEPR